MTELHINHQLPYFHPGNAMGVSVNLLSFGLKQFIESARFKERNLLKDLCDNFKALPSRNPLEYSNLAFNTLTDSIRITICLENFMKSLILLNGYLIHRLDKDLHHSLRKEQFKRPIKLEEIRLTHGWEINPKIETNIEGLNLQIKGILKNTIGLNELTSPYYIKTMGMSSDMMEICNPFFEYRNNLHFYCSETFSIQEQDYARFVKLIDFLNNNLVRIQNELVDVLKMGNERKLKPMQHIT